METNALLPKAQATIRHRSGAPRTYHVRVAVIASWFLSEANALQILINGRRLATQLQDGPFADPPDLVFQAENVLASSARELRRLSTQCRVLPDGIGREPTVIAPGVVENVLKALAKNQRLKLTYGLRGHPEQANEREVSCGGLVFKDGYPYLIALENRAGGKWRHYNLCRAHAAEVLATQANTDNFDLDRHIAQEHNLSHILTREDPWRDLKLRVAQEQLFHFRERPLTPDQTISSEADGEGWFLVTARVPNTIQLLPFLISMGPYIEVVAPDDVRKNLRAWAQGLALVYGEHGDNIRALT